MKNTCILIFVLGSFSLRDNSLNDIQMYKSIDLPDSSTHVSYFLLIYLFGVHCVSWLNILTQIEYYLDFKLRLWWFSGRDFTFRESFKECSLYIRAARFPIQMSITEPCNCPFQTHIPWQIWTLSEASACAWTSVNWKSMKNWKLYELFERNSKGSP